jgi:hypothetical protein
LEGNVVVDSWRLWLNVVLRRCHDWQSMFIYFRHISFTVVNNHICIYFGIRSILDIKVDLMVIICKSGWFHIPEIFLFISYLQTLVQSNYRYSMVDGYIQLTSNTTWFSFTSRWTLVGFTTTYAISAHHH